MREKRIDIFSDDILSLANAICFTSNGVVKRNNELVMGAGIAKLFYNRFPGLGRAAGIAVRKNGNVCQTVAHRNVSVNNRIFNLSVVAFPTKNHYTEPSDTDLILRSARRLQEMVEENKWNLVVLPRPGCGLGKLDWNNIREKLNDILDNRVLVVSQ